MPSKKTKKPSPKKAKAKAKAPSKPRIPRQKALPGMENTKIAAIENAALDYAEIRDQRQELTKQEVDLKTKLLNLMHAQGKTEYKRAGITVSITPEGEKVRVRVRAAEDEDEAPAEVSVRTDETQSDEPEMEHAEAS